MCFILTITTPKANYTNPTILQNYNGFYNPKTQEYTTYILTRKEISISKPFEISIPHKTEKGFIYRIKFKSANPKIHSIKINFREKNSVIPRSNYLFFDIQTSTISIPNTKERFCLPQRTNTYNLFTIPLNPVSCFPNKMGDKINYIKITQYRKEFLIHPVLKDNLLKMIKAAQSDNIHLKINSAYRTNLDQDALHNHYTQKYGQLYSTQHVAKSGHSEHHLGTAIDFQISETREGNFFTSKESSIFKWLDSNAWKYGFIMSYPEYKFAETGYTFEPWHWRYIGTKHTTNIKSLDITLAHYLKLINNAHEFKSTMANT